MDTITDSSPKDAFNYTTSYGPMVAGGLSVVMPMALSAANNLASAPLAILGPTLVGGIAGYYAGSRGTDSYMDVLKGMAGAYGAQMLFMGGVPMGTAV